MMTANEIRVQILTEGIQIAKDAAAKFATADDGGSCNLDCVAVECGRGARFYQEAADYCGINHHTGQWFGRKHIFLDFGTGKATRNMLMNQAACEALKANDWPAMMFYRVSR